MIRAGILFVLTASSVVAAPPETILHNGRIVTVDEQFSIAQALAISGERITHVGDDAEILGLAGPDTKVIDLEGRTVLPGLMDSHVHASGAAVYEFDHPVPEMETISDVLAYIGRRADELEDGQWIVVQQVFVTRLRDQRFPTRKELDRVAPRNPVVFRTGPDAALNSLALERSGIDENFRIPDGEQGQIERDPETGELTGMLRAATRFIKSESAGRSPSFEEQRERLRELLADYNAVGITSISERSGGPSVLDLYKSLLDSGDLTCRVFLCRGIEPNGPWEKVEDQILTAARDPAHEYNNMLWLRGVKVFLDGGMLTGSAYMRQPWGVSPIYNITDPAYRGILQIEPDRMYEIAKLCLANDLQITAHSVGDGAVETLVAVYRRVNDEAFSIEGMRPCITHCNFMSADAIDTMARLGIVADLQPIWLHQDGKTLRDHFGEERTTWFQPYRTLFDRRVIVGGGSDHMQKLGSLRSVNPYNPWLGIWTTLTRLPRWTDEPLHAEQLITREEALRLYTINNARLMFEERNKGSLEPGKLADLIVIDRDYLTCPLDEVREIQVEQTWLGGRLVHSNTGVGRAH